MPVSARLARDPAGRPVALLAATGAAEVRALMELTRGGGPAFRQAGQALAVALGVDPAYGLTVSARQLAVLQLAACGYANAAIAARLSISEDTVKSHLRRVYSLLGARDRAHAVAIGIRLGLLRITSGPHGASIATPQARIAL